MKLEPMTDEQIKCIVRLATAHQGTWPESVQFAITEALAARDAQWQAAIAEQQPVMTYLGRHTMDCGEHGSHDMEMHKLIPAGTKLYALPPKAEPAPQGVQDNNLLLVEVAGLQSSVGHLSALVDEQRRLLVEVEQVCGSDAYGAEFEDGDSELIDKVRAHLAATEPSKPVQAEAPTASSERARIDLSQWEKARFGYFDQAGRFVEFSGEDNELPNDSSPRWVGGLHDMQLLRAALATQQVEAPTASNAEREHFESTVVLDTGDEDADFRRNDDGRYANYYLELAWNGWQARAAFATQQEAQPQAEPFARIEFRRGTPGKENDMPTVVSCDWLPDGIYEVYLADPTGVEPCCGEYAQCHRPCTPRGRWLAQAEPAGGDKEDAERYRWLRERDCWTTAYGGVKWCCEVRAVIDKRDLPFIEANYGKHLDAAIDAARAAQQTGERG